MKQTAVEFLQEALSIHFTHEQEMQFIGLFDQAKEMEKQQIKSAYFQGWGSEMITSEEYYEQTYKSE